MQLSLRVYASSLAFILFVLTSSFAFGQTAVSTDFSDYAPGETVNITGTGFSPGETVTLQVLHVGETGDNATSGAHAPWSVVADDNGNFTATWTVPLDEDE